MNVVNAVNKAEIAMMHAVLAKKFGQLYADIWKVGVNLLLRIKAERSNPYGHSVCWPPKNFSTKSFSIAGHPPLRVASGEAI